MTGLRYIAELLLEGGADVNAQGSKYGNALQIASCWENIKLVKLLQERVPSQVDGPYVLQCQRLLNAVETGHLLREGFTHPAYTIPMPSGCPQE